MDFHYLDLRSVTQVMQRSYRPQQAELTEEEILQRNICEKNIPERNLDEMNIRERNIRERNILLVERAEEQQVLLL